MKQCSERSRIHYRRRSCRTSTADCHQNPSGQALKPPKSEATGMQTNTHRPLEVKVWGDLACFTRPEMKVERVSYPVMTPSAAKGVLESIFWKPQFDWEVDEIAVLKPIRYFSILRNEINTRQTAQTAQRWRSNRRGILRLGRQGATPYPGPAGRGLHHQGSAGGKGRGRRQSRQVQGPVPPPRFVGKELRHPLPGLQGVHRLVRRAGRRRDPGGNQR